MSDTYKLQLRHGAESKNFSTRGEVLEHINGKLTFGGTSLLPYEPVLFFYGADDAKNAIIMVGLPEGKTQNGQSYFIVDTADLKEQIEAIDEKYEEKIESSEEKNAEIFAAIEKETNARKEKDAELEKAIDDEIKERKEKDEEFQNVIDFTKADLMSIIEACGLIYNEKMAEDRVSYTPDMHDEVIRDAKDVTEAIDKVSKFAAQLGESLKLSVENTDTVDLTLETNTKEGGNTLKANVNIAGTEGLSKKNYDNNIIGKTVEGLYASASIEPSAKNPNILIFKTSGYIDGQFKVDAFETEVQLKAYEGDNGNKTGIAVSVDQNKNVVSAELKLASEDTNILKLEDGEYIVEGTAKNIKYKDTTVFNALNTQSKSIEEIEDTIDFVKAFDVKGSESDTTVVDVTKSQKGDFTVSSNVKLSSDKSIIVSDGGLKADVSASFKRGTSTLLINVGKNEYAIDLSELAVSTLKDAKYDATNELLVLEFYVGDTTKTVSISVTNLIHDVEVDDSNTIDMTLTPRTGGPNHISAELRVDKSHSDNILTVNTNGAYVSKAHITDAVKAEADERKDSYDKLKEKLDSVSDSVEDNKDAITKEASTARAAEKANADAIAKEISDARAAEQANTKQIEKNAKAIAENTTAIGEEVTRASKAEQTNAIAIKAEETRAIEKENDLLEKITTNATDIKSLSTEVGKIELKKVDDLSYALYVNGTKHGELVIPKDQFLKSVNYNPTNKELVFVFNTSTGEITTNVSVADLVDIYEAGNGLALNGNTFSIDETVALKSNVAESIKAETDRAKVAEAELSSNINRIDKTAQANTNSISSLSEKLTAEITRSTNTDNEIKGLITAEKERAIQAENGIAANTSEINTIKKGLSDEILRATNAETTINGSIEKEILRATNAETAISKSVTEEVNRAKIAEAANKELIEAETKRAKEREDEIVTSVGTKAESADVFTKVEVNEKLVEYSKTTDIEKKLAEKANVSDLTLSYATKKELRDLEDSTAKKTDVNAADDALSKRIENNEHALNLINITYNSATSELTYVDFEGTSNVYKLYSGSLIKDGTFDTVSNSIVLTIENAGSESKITIPVTQLLSDVDKRITDNSNGITSINNAISKLAKSWKTTDSPTISFTKSTVGEEDELTGKVRVASSNKQAIQATGDGLYVSNDLEDFTCVFGGSGTISAQTAISTLLDNSNSMKQDIQNIKNNVTNASEIEKLGNRVTVNESNINSISKDVEQIKTDIADIKTNGQSSTDVTALKKTVEDVVDRVDTLEGKVININTTVSKLSNEITALKESYDTRIDSLEKTTQNLQTILNKIVDESGNISISGLTDEIEKIRVATGYDKYENEKNMSTRLDEIENSVGGDITDEINDIKNNMIGSKDNPVEGSVWYELNNMIDAGTF